jgi:hypothetical protein
LFLDFVKQVVDIHPHLKIRKLRAGNLHGVPDLNAALNFSFFFSYFTKKIKNLR